MRLRVHKSCIKLLICELIFASSLQRCICSKALMVRDSPPITNLTTPTNKGMISRLLSVDSSGVKKDQSINVSTLSPSAVTSPSPLRLQEEKKEGIIHILFPNINLIL
jgi:hypothetical protein